MCKVFSNAMQKSLLLPKSFQIRQKKPLLGKKFHRQTSTDLALITKTSDVQHLSAKKKLKQMTGAKTALEKNFEPINFVARVGLPFRGSGNDDNNGFTTIPLKRY